MFVMPLASTPPAPVASAVTLTGATIAATGTGVVMAVLYINLDGGLWKYQSPDGSSQIDEATDWIIPNGDADSSYEVRYTNFVFTTGNPVTAGYQHFYAIMAEGEWIDLSATRQLTLFTADIGNPVGVTFDVEIRKDGGAVLATGSFVQTATRTYQ